MKKDTPDRSKKAPIRTKNAGLLARAKHIETTVQAREFEEQTLAFHIKDFLLCGLPYKPLQASEYLRRNGKFSMQMVGTKACGLPYGQDRLVLVWMVTAFQLLGCPENNLLRFRSASDIIRAFFREDQTRKISGLELSRLRGRIERLFYTTFFFKNGIGKQSEELSFRLIRRTHLWFDDTVPNPKGLWQNVLELSPEFANLIRTQSVPFDLQSIQGLKESPGALDLYLWLAWRSFRVSPGNLDGDAIPLFGETGLLCQFSIETSERWKARQQLKGWLDDIKQYWPECPAELSEDGLYLVVKRPQSQGAFAVQANAPIVLPGVTKKPPVPLCPEALSFPPIPGSFFHLGYPEDDE